jgi:hypothetical protein
MKNNKRTGFPRVLLKNLAEDIFKLIKTNEGSLSILEIIEEIPFESRFEVIEGLSSFYDSAMVGFFNLIKVEYGKEFESICNRALTKYNLAGLEANFPPFKKDKFYKAYASVTRHTGRMTIDVAWEKPDHRLYVECFFLTFSTDGVHSFFVVNDMPAIEYEADREKQPDMAEISYEESCLLVRDAYKFNMRFMSRPALGKFLYQTYIDETSAFSNTNMNPILRKLSANLGPRQLVNSFFHALRYQDFNYLFSILAENKLTQNMLLKQIHRTINPGALLLEGQVEEVKGSNNHAELTAYSITLFEQEVYRNDYVFSMTKESGGEWLIANIDRVAACKLDAGSKYNPFDVQVYCRVYEILDVDDLFEILDRVDNIREVEELPYGVHMRVTYFEDDFNHGLTFMTGVIAELVINGDKFVIISQNHDTLEDFHNLFTIDHQSPLVSKGEYELSLSNAYNYLSGQYLQFEDILLDERDDLSFEDGMRFITARYALKDRCKVLSRIEGLKSIMIDLPCEYQVFYQLDDCEDHPGFMAEYILGSNWITVSAFGDKDIVTIRKSFEENMYDALEFDGLEIREEGIFEILTLDVKKQYPGLESALKEMYLNKWYHSRLPSLSGMSPSEACQTEEGTRLLWTMFKKIKQKEQLRRLRGERKQIGLKEYIRKLNLPSEGEY